MAQKAIESVISQNLLYNFSIDEFAQKLSDDLRITLAAGYYNKTVEIEHLISSNQGNREYSSMSFDAIQNALTISKYIPESMNLKLVAEIKKMYEKLQFHGRKTLNSRGSSRKSQRRVFSPPSHNQIKEASFAQIQKFFDSSPKSMDSSNGFYRTNNEQVVSPLIGRRKYNVSEAKGNRTEFAISYSPIKSEEDKVSESDQSLQFPPKYSNKVVISKPVQQINFGSRFGGGNFPLLRPKLEQAKTSFDVQPVNAPLKTNHFQIERSSVPER